jgi:cyclopropane fatty-acyl-phospholipid synthase-like methyltransferase
MIPAQNINDGFFKGLYKDVWRELIPPGLSEAETDFIAEIAHLEKGQRVLDIMCGYGRHALLLAQRGYTVTAVDNLPEYVAEINSAAASGGLPVEAICGSALDISLNGYYDAAICMGNSFAFFNEADALTVLQKLSAHLKPGGLFLINTWMLGEIAIRHFKPKDWFYAGRYKYLIDNQYHFDPARIESEHIIIRDDGETETIAGVDYILTLGELAKMLQAAGMELNAVYATPRKRPFQMGDTRAYIVAKKSASTP